MEFLLGLLAGIAVAYLALRLISSEIRSSVPVKLSYRQSDVFDALVPVLEYNRYVDVAARNTQSTKFLDKDSIRVLVHGNQAYWIKDNAIFTSEIINGNIDQSNAKKVDTMVMDKTELDRISFIVQELTKGTDYDRRNPRY